MRRRTSYEFLEAAAFNVIADDNNAKSRLADIERFTPAFPNSRFDEPVASYAMMSLSELKDTSKVIAYGEKTLATNPNSLPTLLLLAGTYVEDPKPGSVAKATTYAQGRSPWPKPMLRTRTAPASCQPEWLTPLWATRT